MSTDYRIHIKRKSDNKEIAVFLGNAIKNILDGCHANIIHCESRYTIDKCKFTYDELDNLSQIIYKDLVSKFEDITKQELMLCCAKSKEAIEDIKDQIQYNKEIIEEDLKWQLYGVHVLLGHIQCVVENEYRKNNPAYLYNVKDLNKDKDESKTIWCSDIYCEIEAC